MKREVFQNQVAATAKKTRKKTRKKISEEPRPAQHSNNLALETTTIDDHFV